jgi:hypothetical protein
LVSIVTRIATVGLAADIAARLFSVVFLRAGLSHAAALIATLNSKNLVPVIAGQVLLSADHIE